MLPLLAPISIFKIYLPLLSGRGKEPRPLDAHSTERGVVTGGWGLFPKLRRMAFVRDPVRRIWGSGGFVGVGDLPCAGPLVLEFEQRLPRAPGRSVSGGHRCCAMPIVGFSIRSILWKYPPSPQPKKGDVFSTVVSATPEAVRGFI